MLRYYQFGAVELHDELLNSQEKLDKILKALLTTLCLYRKISFTYVRDSIFKTVKKFEEETPEGDPWYPYVMSIIEKVSYSTSYISTFFASSDANCSSCSARKSTLIFITAKATWKLPTPTSSS